MSFLVDTCFYPKNNFKNLSKFLCSAVTLKTSDSVCTKFINFLTAKIEISSTWILFPIICPTKLVHGLNFSLHSGIKFPITEYRWLHFSVKAIQRVWQGKFLKSHLKSPSKKSKEFDHWRNDSPYVPRTLYPGLCWWFLLINDTFGRLEEY